MELVVAALLVVLLFEGCLSLKMAGEPTPSAGTDVPSGGSPPSGGEPSPGTPPAGGTPPQPAPAEGGSSPSTSMDVTPQHVLELGDGTSMSIGDLVNKAGKCPSDEDLAEYAVWKSAKEGDSEAIRKIVEQSLPPKTGTPVVGSPPEGPVVAGEAEGLISSLQKEVKDLREAVSKMSPVVGGITSQAESNQLSQMVDQKEKDLPFLSKQPRKGSLVRSRMGWYFEQARKAGRNLEEMGQAVIGQVIEQSMKDVEAQLRETLAPYGVSSPAAGGGQPRIVSVNDQVPSSPGAKLPRYQLREGVFVDTEAAPAPATAGQPLPSEPVTPVPSGVPVGAESPAPTGRFSREGLEARMKARITKVEGV